jgi:hypothetical protein
MLGNCDKKLFYIAISHVALPTVEKVLNYIPEVFV